MSAVDPQGSQKYGFNGLPYPGLLIATNEIRTVKFWFNGLPVQTLFPNAFISPTPPPKKTPPGQDKKEVKYWARVQLHKVRREVRKEEGAALVFMPAEYLSPVSGGSAVRGGAESIDVRVKTKIIQSSPSGHKVRKS